MQPFSLEKPVALSTASKFSAVLIGVLTLVEYITLCDGLSLARQYGGRGINITYYSVCVVLTIGHTACMVGL